MPHPLVTICRPAWRDLLAMAAGHEREGGGLLIGRRTARGNFRIAKVTGITHAQATEDQLLYDRDELAKARLAAYEAYKPLEPVGGWHTHPYSECVGEALLPLISDDWQDPGSDVSDMQDGDIEVVCAVFPKPAYCLKAGDYTVLRVLAGVTCRAEAWLRVKRGKLTPCRITVR